jgi:nucleoside-diphosphate-sugar epimerase
MSVLVTGADGFVGRAVCDTLRRSGWHVREAVRSAGNSSGFAKAGDRVVVGSIGPTTDWTDALRGVSRVVHCAARAHVIGEREVRPLEAYRHVNVEGTRRLAEQAESAGVKRIVFLSSIGVHGLSTAFGQAFKSCDVPAPHDDYSLSKLEAERVLEDLAARGRQLERVIVRPPLVHGPRTKGNLLRLMRLVGTGVPLPFGDIRNRRALVGVDNLADLVRSCVDHPAAAGKVFLVRDDEEVSTTDLLRYVATDMGSRTRLFAVPSALLRAVARAARKATELDRLCGSLSVDDSHTRASLGWAPRKTLRDGISDMVRWYVNEIRH